MTVKILNTFIALAYLSVGIFCSTTVLAQKTASNSYKHDTTKAVNDLIYWNKYFGDKQTNLQWKTDNNKTPVVSYTLDVSSWPYGLKGSTIKTSYPLNEVDKQIARKALELWSNVGNIKFVEKQGDDIKNPNDVDMVIRQTQFKGSMKNYLGLALPYADFGHDQHRIIAADVLIATPHPIVMVHEIGHALGLDHAEGEYNKPEYTIMHDRHRNSFKVLPLTPMVNDVAAIQTIYGPNHDYLKDNTLHMYRGGPKTLDKLYGYTIWDGGGLDTLTSVTVTDDVSLDLREGTQHYSNIGKQRIWIALGAQIENAISGYGNDTLNGNTLDNMLNAGDGDDLIIGGSGQDKLIGGAGKNIFAFGYTTDSTKSSPDEIVDFKSGQDKIKFLKTSGINNFKQLQLKSSSSNQNTYIVTTDGHFSILLRGQQVLTAKDFIFE